MVDFLFVQRRSKHFLFFFLSTKASFVKRRKNMKPTKAWKTRKGSILIWTKLETTTIIHCQTFFNKRRPRQEAGIIKFIDPFALQVLYYFKRFFLFFSSAYFSLENTLTILETWKIVILHMFENLKEKSSGNKKSENKINQCKTKRRKLN